MTDTVAQLYTEAQGAPPGELVPVDRPPSVPEDCLLARFGMSLTHVGRARARVTMTVAPIHLNQRGAVQAGALVALADATAGWATYAAVEHGRFTTLELKANLLRNAASGDVLYADARPVHVGRRTAVFDVDVLSAPERLVARFTCTQLILEPAAAGPTA